MPTVLVVDDLAVDRQVAGQLLKEAGDLEVEYAEDGAQALAAIERGVPDLVVTDLVMPNVDGLELVGRVRKQYSLVPVILMTSKGSEEIAVQALQQGAAGYIPKRTLAEDLLRTAHRVLAVSAGKLVHRRMMGCMVANEREFVLESDPALFALLVDHLQNNLLQMGLCDDTDLTRVGVALEEALTNALYHGNLEVGSELRGLDDDAYHALIRTRRARAPYRDRRIHIRMKLSSEQAAFTIEDEGPGFDVASLPDPTDPANLEKASGRGVLLMRAFMDDVLFSDAGNAVTLVKNPKTA